MNTCSHILVGSLVYEHLKTEQGIYLEKSSFISGNVIPDRTSLAVTHPHFMKFSLGFVQAEIEALSEIYLESAFVGSEYSRRLGIICHYYADFFCYAHSSGYKQIVVNHMKYERLLYEYFQNNFDKIAGTKLASADNISTNANEINDKMRAFHANYSAGEHAYGKDLIYALSACAATVMSLVYCSVRKSAGEPMEMYQTTAAV
jgi:hypothetical protein